MLEKKKVLHILVGGDTFNGIAGCLHQYYLHMDREKVQYDFLFCLKNCMEMVKDDPIYEKSNFYELGAYRKNSKSKSYCLIYRKLKKFLRDHEYDVIVINTSVIAVVFACMLAAKAKPNLKIIAHGHNAGLIVKKNSIRAKLKVLVDLFDTICRWFVRGNCDYFFGCSKEAGISTFGKPIATNENFRVVHNALPIQEYIFNSEVRTEVRKNQSIEKNTVVYGNVGKLSILKNQTFMLEVFCEIQKRQRNSVLWLIGDGEERDNLEKKAAELGILDSVRFFGQRNDVNELLQGMDCFVFTSKSEGLGTVSIEAQTAGLPTIISDGVPTSANISELCLQLSLKESADVWADKILKFCEKHKEKQNMRDTAAEAGYDIEKEAEKMTQFYLSICNKNAAE